MSGTARPSLSAELRDLGQIFKGLVPKFFRGATIDDAEAMEAFAEIVVKNFTTAAFRCLAVHAAAEHLGVSPARVAFFFAPGELGGAWGGEAPEVGVH